MKHLPILLLLSTLIIGCSTYSKKECQEMDWYVQGKKSALSGEMRKQGKTHFIDKCQEDQGVTIDVVDFDRGFTSGLNKLCTPEGREALESKGIKYQRTCDSHEDSLDSQKTRMSDLEGKIQKLQAENAQLAAEVDALKSKENSCPAPQ